MEAGERRAISNRFRLMARFWQQYLIELNPNKFFREALNINNCHIIWSLSTEKLKTSYSFSNTTDLIQTLYNIIRWHFALLRIPKKNHWKPCNYEL